MNIERSTINQTTQNEQDKLHLSVLLYAGNKREKILKWMRKFSTRVLPCNVKTCTAYSGTKLSTKFQLKDLTKKDHQHDVANYAKCPEEQCTEDYTGETGRHLIERVKITVEKIQSPIYLNMRWKQTTKWCHYMTFKSWEKVTKYQNLDIN